MDKLKNVAKKGVHPTGEHEIHRKTWKSDVKDIALRRDPNKGYLEQARAHRSAPLSALKDPDSFGPPPKHTGVHPGASASSSSPVSAAPLRQPARTAAGGWGAPVPAPRRRQEEEEDEEEDAKPPLPYRTDTTGLRTDNLPAPPVRRADDGDEEQAPAPPPRHISPASPALPVRPSQQQFLSEEGPAPGLPPRMNEHPNEYTPPAPPSYQEAAKAAQHAAPLLNQSSLNRLGQAGVSVSGLGIGQSGRNAAPQISSTQTANAAKQAAPLLNQGSLNRLGQAGISVPGLDIGHSPHDAAPQSPPGSQGHPGQLSELQQRFARMNAGTPSTVATSSITHADAAAAAAKKPPPPPPPPKKPGLASGSGSRPSTADNSNAPPPLPMASKPRPT